jgi:uncharacterized protein (DUF3820 family)
MNRTLLSYINTDIIRFFGKVSKIMRDKPEEALKKFAEKQFDPEMVKHLLKILNPDRG